MAMSTVSSTNIKMVSKCLILFNEQSKRTKIQGTQSQFNSQTCALLANAFYKSFNRMLSCTLSICCSKHNYKSGVWSQLSDY